MNDEEIRHGSTVWIKDGLDKGRKGVVDIKGFGQVSVVLEGETKVFSQSSVTTKNPNRIPLPPNFLPLEFKLGDKVVVTNHRNTGLNGTIGTVMALPSSVTRTGDPADNRYRIRVSTPAKISGYSAGVNLWFAPEDLKAALKSDRIEGQEIAHEDVRIGDIIRTELRSGDGNYSHVSIKEGKVNALTRKKWPSAVETDAEVYSFSTDRNHGLTFQHKDEKIILVKKAESPYVQILKDLAKGTVVSLEKDGGEVITYIKSVPWAGTVQWHEISSGSGRSSTFVTEEAIVDILSRGVAEIAHKVRKSSVIPVPAF